MLNLETILDGNPKFLAGEFSALELSNIKLIELDPVGGVLTGGLHVGRPSLWAPVSCYVLVNHTCIFGLLCCVTCW